MPVRFVHPLDDAWREAIDRVLRARGWPTLDAPARLGPLVARLSAAYNADPSGAAATPSQEKTRGATPLVAAGDLLAARLAFSFARDVPKSAGAVRELSATGLLGVEGDRPFRILDVGAGLGASTWGIVRALAANGRGARRVEATWVDADGQALALGAELARAAPRGDVELQVVTRTADVTSPTLLHAATREARRVSPERDAERRPYDVIVLGQVLSEITGRGADATLDPDAEARARAERHATLLATLAADLLADDGALVVVEPALRERTRHLHAVRAALLAAAAAPSPPRAPLGVFAPCLHAEACPLLAKPTDWCHEDLPIDLPPWLVPVARAAGLRWQGLTFSYLVLRKDGRRLAAFTAARGPGEAAHLTGGARLRLVSDLIRTKGKREALACGVLRADAPGGGARLMRLDRDAAPLNADFDDARRGELFAAAALEPGALVRVGATTHLSRIDLEEPA